MVRTAPPVAGAQRRRQPVAGLGLGGDARVEDRQCFSSLVKPYA
ncbi:hypothetical protein [Actinomadura miaoliensis]